MKISRSVKLYFCFSMVALGLSLAMLASSFSAYYYVLGMDAELRSTMVLASDIKGVSDGEPKETFGFIVASRWEDLPLEIRNKFVSDPKGQYELKKFLPKTSLFSHPEAGYYTLLAINEEGEKRYVAKVFTNILPKRLCPEDYDQFGDISAFGVLIFCFFSLSLALFLNSIAKPVEQLIHWATNLRDGNYELPENGFKFKELDNLSELIRNNIVAVHQSVRREKEFLDYSSHELRTPLATIKSNIELLGLWEQLDGAKRNNVVKRLERAANTMSGLTNTLLWLTKEDYSKLNKEQIQLDLLLDEVVKENYYLLNEREVTVKLENSPYDMVASKEACRIVLGNIVRNAFQHTYSGTVRLKQIEGQLVCENINLDKQFDNGSGVGFGLGLKLIKKVTENTGWLFSNTESEFGRYVTLSFK
ncbi:Signal transduction histidine kinase [Ferrimonas sediminum]|uniref:histidine kinase n=1 Tax=Ferrimonas sediminum TaxID=718193 RepID=A0A1G8WFQ4_9GAMM|nr:HAMP domain-containing sensor histidine kinase [Ferrimonas sediminum]SDJ76993.1 Signal transduction histidine kinase [Ferrimonas sediminum]